MTEIMKDIFDHWESKMKGVIGENNLVWITNGTSKVNNLLSEFTPFQTILLTVFTILVLGLSLYLTIYICKILYKNIKKISKKNIPNGELITLTNTIKEGQPELKYAKLTGKKPFNLIQRILDTRFTDQLEHGKQKIISGHSGYMIGDRNQKRQEVVSYAFAKFACSRSHAPNTYPETHKMYMEICSIVSGMVKGVGGKAFTLLAQSAWELWMIIISNYLYKYTLKNNTGVTNIITIGGVNSQIEIICNRLGIEVRALSDTRDLKSKVDNRTLCIIGSCTDSSLGIVGPKLPSSGFPETPIHNDASSLGLYSIFCNTIPHYPHLELSSCTSLSLHLGEGAFGGVYALVYRDSNDYMAEGNRLRGLEGAGWMPALNNGSGLNGGVVAAVFTRLLMVSQDEYLEEAKLIGQGVAAFIKGLRDIPQLVLLGDRQYHITEVAFEARNKRVLNMFLLGQKAKEAGIIFDILPQYPALKFRFTHSNITQVTQILKYLAANIPLLIGKRWEGYALLEGLKRRSGCRNIGEVLKTFHQVYVYPPDLHIAKPKKVNVKKNKPKKQ